MPQEPKEISLLSKWTRFKNAILRYTALATHVVLLFVVFWFIIHRVSPGFLPHLEALVGDESKFEISFSLILIVLIIEAQLVIIKQTEVNRSFAYDTEESAYDALFKRIRDNNVKKIDLIQLSGQTAVGFLRNILSLPYPVKVRILFLHDDISVRFDHDESSKFPEHYDHIGRLNTTLEQLKQAATLNRKQMPDIRYYRSYPSVCSVLIDNKTICMAWYRTFFDGKQVLRVRSHDGAAIITDREKSEPMVEFARMHFEKLWYYAENERTSRNRTSAII
jgi:hypothetical protein